MMSTSTMELADYKELVANSASVSTILQFLSGVLVCQKFVKKGSSTDVSGFPFVAGFLSCSLWFGYGTLIDDTNIILVNAVGSILMISYTVTYYMYTNRKNVIVKQLVGAFVVIVAMHLYIRFEDDKLVAQNRLGVISCSTTLMFFAAPLFNLAHVLRVKNAESLPFPIILMTFVVSFQWLIYGIILEDPFIKYPNVAGCVLSLFQLSLFVIYPSR